MERGEGTLRPRGVLKRRRVGRRAAVSAAVSFVALASLLAYAKAVGTGRGAYAPADVCPRGALVYAQASDLPALLRLWDASEL